MPLTIALQRSICRCISSISSRSSGSPANGAMWAQSPRITDSVASGVPSSCAAPEASRPMRTMCSSSAARWRSRARLSSRWRRLRPMRPMKITSSAALSRKHTSSPPTYSGDSATVSPGMASGWCHSVSVTKPRPAQNTMAQM